VSDDSDAMDVDAVKRRLAHALALQAGSLLTLTSSPARRPGSWAPPSAPLLTEAAAAEVADTQRLPAKLVALGGTVSSYDIPTPPLADLRMALAGHLDREKQVMAELHGVIDAFGQEPRSEALEHLLEHILLRKQEVVDALRLALG